MDVCKAKISKPKETVIVKDYSTKVINKYRAQFNKEKELFKLLAKHKIPALVYKDEQEIRGKSTLIFEYMKNVVVLSEFLKNRNLTEKKIYEIVQNMLNSIIIPLCQTQKISLSFISLDNFLIGNFIY